VAADLHVLGGGQRVQRDVRAVSAASGHLLRVWQRGDAAVAAARQQLTEGQRWTAGLAAGVALLVLLLGLPPAVVAGAAAAAPAASGGVAAPTSPGPVAPRHLGPVAPAAGAASAPETTWVGRSRPADGQPALPVRTLSAPGMLRAVALVRSGDGPPGRDDAAIASAFIDATGVETSVVPETDDATATCTAAARAGTIVLASSTLPPALRDCLIQRGLTVLAYDEDGTGPRSPAGGRLLSTRVSSTNALLDLAHWGLRDGSLRGKVGVVADAARQAALAPGVRALVAAGVDVVGTVWSDGGAGVDGPLALQQSGATTVVLAAPMATQRSWLAGATLVGYAPHYVVADVADAVADETYPATFDGAVARTTLRIPWQARAQGRPTPEQADCDALWQAKATPPVTLPTEEVRVYAWCEAAAALASAAGAAAVTGVDPAAALARLTLTSPLTLDLRPTGLGWGPMRRAVLVWHATCSCWSERSATTGIPQQMEIQRAYRHS
jgi:hypothetical protein